MNIAISITRADQTRNPYFYVPVTVPAGTTRIDVAMAYAKAEDCVIDLGMFDAELTDYPSRAGFRGWSGGARTHFVIATDDATPGYVHGPIAPGSWQIVLGLYKVPETGVSVTLDIAFDSAPRPVLPQPIRTRPVRPGAGWYKGDLHCHTFHSDAQGAPETLHAAARQAGLDFLAVADHNTITQRRYFHQASSPDLVFIRAMEVTTAEGHANVFGVDDWIDFRMTRPEHAHMLARLVHEKGGLLSINHDKPVIPWDYDFPDADCQEVWQSHWLALNWIALDRYQRRLVEGRRLSLIGGSDFHQPATLQPEGPLVLARPTTVLWLEQLSEDDVLAAMKRGRGYVTESPSGPVLAITLNDVPMGGMVTARTGLTAQAEIRGAQGDELVWIDATGPIARQTIEGDDVHIRLERTGISGFLRAEIIAVASRQARLDEIADILAQPSARRQWQDLDLENQPIRRALSNPVYLAST